ncbi:MAG: MGMT family protein [Deltaproteobacteria bacterium]|nr:MGMT family protein [Deltaproteobacteria bacterium]
MAQPDFHERCYAALRKVPKGKITTYADLARHLGSKGYRAVGNAMNRNPYAPQVPCHRVVRSNGEIGGFARGTPAKIRMLRAEGIEIVSERVVNLDNFRYRFPRTKQR